MRLSVGLLQDLKPRLTNGALIACANRLLNASNSEPSKPAPGNQLDVLLSKRELEVLRDLAQGLSYAEISQRLYLALSTVKGHNLRIFNKLQVQNRTEAVARESGLL